MTDDEDSDVEMSVRRSMRRKRDRSEWTEVVEMSVRKTRSKGTGETFTVSTLGGQPDHNKVQPPQLQPFCSSCGYKFDSDFLARSLLRDLRIRFDCGCLSVALSQSLKEFSMMC